jgi:adenosylhomocysteine nucleosidase
MIFDCGFVIPLESEANCLIKKLINPKVYEKGTKKIILGELMNQKVSIIISGCGKIKSASATQFLIDKYPAKYYIHYGSAGALSSSLTIGDIVVADEVVEHDVKELFPKKIPPPVHVISANLFFLKRIVDNRNIHLGRILSGDEDVMTTERRKELAKEYNGLCVDWESAGFVLTCRLNKAEGIVLRVISDLAHEFTHQEYETNKEKVMDNILLTIRLIMDKNSGYSNF